jgi:hypothetical protein
MRFATGRILTQEFHEINGWIAYLIANAIAQRAVLPM